MVLQVMSIKAIGIAIELTIEGTNQAKYFATWVFAMVAITCIITQLNYLNMVRVYICLHLPLSFVSLVKSNIILYGNTLTWDKMSFIYYL